MNASPQYQMGGHHKQKPAQVHIFHGKERRGTARRPTKAPANAMRGIRKAASRATGVSNAFGGKKQKAEAPAQKRQDMISEIKNAPTHHQLLPPPEEAPAAEEKSEAPPAAASVAEVEPFEPPPPATDGPLVWPLFSKTQGSFFTLRRGEKLAQASEIRTHTMRERERERRTDGRTGRQTISGWRALCESPPSTTTRHRHILTVVILTRTT